jgi:rSAM/selenodomain-associated transferase 1
MSQQLLIIMARYPAPGKVKTRLARDIGVAAATKWYRGMLFHFRREFSRTRFDVEWWYTPVRSPFRRLFWLNRINGRPQPAGNLGERMQAIFADAFARGYRRVVMIGTDAPQMNQATVRRAFRLLRRHNAVAQPTDDGGYALIGLAGPVDVFSDIAWGTDKVMAQTRQRLRRLGATVAELPATFDVDTAADIAKLAQLQTRNQPWRTRDETKQHDIDADGRARHRRLDGVAGAGASAGGERQIPDHSSGRQGKP